MATTTDVRPAAPSPEAPVRRRGRVVFAVPWAVAALLGAAVAWAVPQARESDRLSAASSALDGRLGEAQTALQTAEDRLAALEERLRNAREQSAELAKTERQNERLIKELEARVEDLEAAAAAAAAEEAAASQAGEQQPTFVGPTAPPDPPEYCFWSTDLSSGERKRVCL
ncbi:MAG TPA: hypothetical protein VHL78_12610 [Actinomycetota bacterium]|nr:hypothetical protein [Actinomycetota bacterium]